MQTIDDQQSGSLLADPNIFLEMWTNDREKLDAAYPFFPLSFPGIPAPGPDFIDLAALFAGVKDAKNKLDELEVWLDYLYRSALYMPKFSLGIAVKDVRVPVQFVAGHKLNTADVGPTPAKVMIVGEKIGWQEFQQGRNFVGKTSSVLFETLFDIGADQSEVGEWYATNVVRHMPPDPSTNRLAAQWIKNCLPLLAEELRLVQPEYILCLGSVAAEHILGKKQRIDMLSGQVFDIKTPIALPEDKRKTPEYHVSRVMVVRHPAFISRTPEALPAFKKGLQQFVHMVETGDATIRSTSVKYRAIYNADELNRVVDDIIADPDPRTRIVAIDCEWHGDLPDEPQSYLRTIQFSARDDEAFIVVLRHPGGEEAFRPNIQAAVEPLRRLLIPRPGYPVKLGGHFLRADAPWLIHLGVDIRKSMIPAPRSFSSWDEDPDSPGGWDTGFELHALHESAPSFELEQWAVYYTDCHRYDVELDKWVEKEKKRLGVKDLGGYGNVPNDILFEYGAHDAVQPRKMHMIMHGTHKNPGPLRSDQFGNDARQAAWITQAATLPFLEMEMRGVRFDLQRAIDLTEQYEQAYAKLLAEFREEIKWPTFNPQSSQHCREFLFGEEYNGAKRKDPSKPVRLRPEDAKCLYLKPIKSAGNKGKSWDRVVQDGEEGLLNPGTDKETLGIFGSVEPLAKKLRDLRFVSQVLRSVLARPERDSQGNLVLNDRGEKIFKKGAISFVKHDGRLHTRFFPVETGRVSSSRPPLQNWSKRRESDYKRILGSLYKYPLRSMIVATPGHALVEVDLASAEMAALGWLSQDETMIEHVRRNQLPEDHPDFLDMHSATAVRAFRLDCPPTKSGLKSIGKSSLRVAAKAVNFGIPYGRGDEALARQCNEEIDDGSEVSVQDAAKLRAEYCNTYPVAVEYLRECANRVLDPGWICGGFYRYRRFYAKNAPRDDNKLIAELQRQAQNFPIQNLVADAVSLIMWNLYAEREIRGWEDRFYFLLQIHDAVIFEVPVNWLEWFVDELIPNNFARSVPIVPLDLDGEPLNIDEPYYFGTTTEVFYHWSENLTKETCYETGIPERFAEG